MSIKVTDALKKKKLTLLYTAPYSPMCNPIESFFHELKTEFFRRYTPSKSEIDLKRKIEEALLPFQDRDLSGHIRSVLNLSIPIFFDSQSHSKDGTIS